MSAPSPASSLFDKATPHDCRPRLFGGKGEVRVWSLLDAPLLPFRAVLACELSPAASVGVHVQEQCPELVIGVSGVGSVAVNGVASRFGPGTVVELPLGHTLALENDSDHEPLRYFIIKAS
jgi:hypothetical protein